MTELTPGVSTQRFTLEIRPGKSVKDPDYGISAAVRIDERYLIIANDEQVALQLLEGDAATGFRHKKTFSLDKLLKLPEGATRECDLEGLAIDGGYLWLVGSHAVTRDKPEGKKLGIRIDKLADTDRDGNRQLLARLPLVTSKSGVPDLVAKTKDGRKAARLKFKKGKRKSELIRRLEDDPHLDRFIDLPAKENGFDVEGLAARDGRLWVGLRGPVLRGYAIILELRPGDRDDGFLKLSRVDGNKDRYSKHFIQLDGLGVRSLYWDGDDLMILAGPTLDTSNPTRLYRWAGAFNAKGPTLVGAPEVSRVMELPHGDTRDHPEALVPVNGGGDLMLFHDRPSAKRVNRTANTVAMDLISNTAPAG